MSSQKSRPLLYTYRRCPYAMRARMALLAAGVDFDAHEISLRNKPAAMLAISPKGTVPVLLLPDGQVIEQSLDIMRWAFEGQVQGQGQDHQMDSGHWWQRAMTPANLALITCTDGPFKQHLDHYKYPERFTELNRADERSSALACLLEPLDQRLSDEPFLGGLAPCAADLAIFPFVRQFRAVDDAWFDAQPLPATRQWLLAWLQSSQFAVCMKKLPAETRVRFSDPPA